ncbi:carbohydrate-binding module family 20 domain-containing protein [Streptomyces glaucescens]|uniref:Alpha-amylase n=1 Tax=Streptomyces glaucescens TaxID=1907 RepID=A0A089XIK3_STRGA|nr:carbohydrate-binding module family 20 domain-containing protein [Streptomyces glaucescens]AIS01020.1 putative alpha-amylase [Streptomyces glaucescens]
MRSIAPARRRTAAALTGAGLVLGLTTTLAAPAQPAAAAPSANGDKKVTAVLFEWSFDSIARECTRTLGPKGYGYVQVSPPQERIQGSAWWTAYQPVSYKIQGPLGDRDSFRAMVNTCHEAGVKVVVDAVLNHMTSGSGTGTAGTQYSKYNYPGTYGDADFHGCRRPIGSDYKDRSNVQDCELGETGKPSLADLDTGSDYVRGRIAGYLNDLLSLGVDGFRMDAVKHIPATDLAAIRGKLTDRNVHWMQEAIHGAGEAVSPSEYLATGDVQEFRYTTDLKRVFGNEKLAYLKNFGEAWGYMPSGQSGTMVANHDTERNGSSLSYRDGANYTLAHVFMLAHPYGAPSVHSGYEFGDRDAGAPNGHQVNACYSNGWSCQHAWRQIANMVAFRNASEGTGITNWWDNGSNAVAFGRGSKAYVAVNHEGGSLTQTFQTSLPAGTYCDVQHGDPTADGGCTGTTYTVGADGKFTATIGGNDAVALHVGARVGDKPGDHTATVYYSTGKNWSAYHIHYAPTGGAWTTAPGAAMESACTGWVKKTITLGSATGLKAAFNNGAGTWDNNSGADYTLGTGDITVRNGIVGTGNPCGDQQTESGASFAVTATTVPGQNVYVVGDQAALGTWSPAAALKLDPAAYPVWKLDVKLPAGTSFEYKYIRKDASGNVTWESGANRTATVPADGRIALNDTWRG